MARWTPATTLGLLSAILIAGCSYEELEELHRLQNAIVNGTLDPGHPAVGLTTVQGQGYCSATLIGSRTVLTAAHCVVSEGSKTLEPQQGFSPDGTGAPIPAVSVVFHPSYDDVAINNDVAVMRLAHDVPGVTPVLIAQAAPAVGEQLIIVGYGQTSDEAYDTFGTKRVTQNSIGKVTPTQYAFYGASGNKGSHCYGDSGGPSFVMRGGKEYQVGVHSWGESYCGVAEYDARVDAFYAWIKQQAQGNLYDGQTAPQDAKPPSVQIVSPAPNAQVGSAFAVQVTAQDDVGVTSVDLLVDGQTTGSRPQPPYSFQVSGLSPGPHNLRAEAADGSGNRGSAMLTVQVQGQAGPDSPPSPGPNPTLPAQPGGAGFDEMQGTCSLVPVGSRAAWPRLPLVLLLATLLLRRRD